MADSPLQLGITAFKKGDKENARVYLLHAVREEPNNETAWGWLSNTGENMEDRIHCLRQVLRINPQNGAARKIVDDYEKSEWARNIPQMNSPAPKQPVPTYVPIQTSQVPTSSTDVTTIPTIIVILLVIMILYWLGIGLFQIGTAASMAANNLFPGDLFWYGVWNIGISIINGAIIPRVLGRKKNAVSGLILLSIVGTVLGLIQTISNFNVIQICPIPLYIVLGILTQSGKNIFVNQ